MTSFYEEAVAAVKDTLGGKEDRIPWQIGYLGDGTGDDAAVRTARENYYWVRYPYTNSPAVPVYCVNNVPLVPGIRVKVGYLPWEPGVFQIITQSDARLNANDSTTSDDVENPAPPGQYANVLPHMVNHMYLNIDPVAINWRQITPLGVFPTSPASLSVQVYSGYIPRPGTDIFVTAQTVDLTASVPVSGARYVLISYDSTGTVVATDGTVNLGGFGALTAADIPDTPAGNWRSCAVVLYASQTAIVETRNEIDFYDLRFPEETTAGSITPSQIGGATAQYQYIVSGASPFTPVWSAGFLNIASAKTLTVSNTLTLAAGADGYTLTVPATGTAALGTGAANTLTIWSGVNTLTNVANAVGRLYNDGAGAFSWSNVADEEVLHDKIGSPALFTLHDDWITRGSAGVIDGTLTYVEADPGAGTHHIKVNAGDGYLRASNDQQGELKFIHWAAATAIEIPTPAAGQETARFVGVEYNSGSPQYTVRTTFNWNWYTDFPLARVSYDGTTLRILNAYAHSEDTANFSRRIWRLTHPFIREEAPEGSGGLEVSDVATRQLAVTAGNIWHGFNRYVLTAITAGTAFDTHYRRAGGGFNSTTGVTQWPNTQYDDGSGALVTMTNNRFACLWVFIDVSDNSLDVLYGRNQYTSVALAQAEGVPSTPEHLTYHGRLIARLIFQKSASAATLVESAWTSQFTPSVISDHNLLSGLQGGAASEYYHLTSAEYTKFQGIGSGTAGRLAEWADIDTLQASTLIKSGAGVLTLSAAGTATLTIDASLEIDTTGAAITNVLAYDGSKWVPAAAGTGTPGGLDSYVQYNNGGVFGGDADLTWDDTGKALTVSGGGYPTGYGLIQGKNNGTDLGLAIYGGTGTAGNSGGAVKIVGGTGAAGSNGGSIVLTPGTGGAGGNNAWIAFRDLTSAFHVVFEFETLTTDRLLRFPNVAGTFALGTGTATRLAAWSNTNVLQASTLIKAETGILTINTNGTSDNSTLGKSGVGALSLVAADDINLTLLSTQRIGTGGVGLYIFDGTYSFSIMGKVEANASLLLQGDGELLYSGAYALTVAGNASVSGTNTGDQTIPVADNPSANVGLTTVNGAAATFMRSDAAPALSQAIVPTWTGIHTFNNTTDASSVSTGSIITAGGAGIAKKLYVGSDTIITGGITASGVSVSFNNANPIMILGVGSAGVSSAFRILPNVGGKNYIQGGESTSDTTANITFSRYGSTSNLATIDMLTDAAYVKGVLGVGVAATAGVGVQVVNDTIGGAFYVVDAGTTNNVHGLQLVHNSSGTPAAGFSLDIAYYLNSSTTDSTTACLDAVSWVDATHATRKARRIINVYDTAARECLRMEASGTAPTIGFLGAGAVARQTIGAAAPAGGTGATAGAYDTAAHRDSAITLLNNIRTALINLGLCQN